ncbi:outer membrane protein [Legionella yabuuchiae]|uniref:outer membrane protein n=1 Tax=Legionella yabuuchiae TaxID=376727 RepID=UPI0010544EC5|nr:outer membrane beta-barrel protein [Legionella yabuuchiae]
MRIALIPAAIIASTAAYAATPIDGLYSSVFGGYTYLPNNISITRQGLTRTDSDYQSGFNAGGSIGYKSNPLRYEGQLTYLSANLNKFRINGIQQTGVTGYSNAILGMANVYYDIPPILEPIQPFLGVGLGYAWVHAKLGSTGPGVTTSYEGSNSVFAYQALAGLTYNFAENYALNLGYRYIGTERADDLGKVFQAHSAYLEVVYRFNEVLYK